METFPVRALSLALPWLPRNPPKLPQLCHLCGVCRANPFGSYQATQKSDIAFGATQAAQKSNPSCARHAISVDFAEFRNCRLASLNMLQNSVDIACGHHPPSERAVGGTRALTNSIILECACSGMPAPALYVIRPALRCLAKEIAKCCQVVPSQCFQMLPVWHCLIQPVNAEASDV